MEGRAQASSGADGRGGMIAGLVKTRDKVGFTVLNNIVDTEQGGVVLVL